MKKKELKSVLLLGLLFFCITTVFSQTNEDVFIDNLISRMTLREKIGQMHQLAASSGYITGFDNIENAHNAIREGEIGSFISDNLGIENINKLQRIAVEESRLGIPLIFARDVIHGYKTIFPIPLGQAASWNPKLIEDGARYAALEATSDGIRWTFAPMIDVTRDPRWGRIAESLGEDSYLTSILGVAMVNGFQGNNSEKPTLMAACAKHFAGYGASEAGKDYNTTWIPEHQLREVFLPPFKAASYAGVLSFMCSFNDINGIPSSGNKYLNTNILRNEWDFNGVLVSDWESIKQMIDHGVCGNLEETAEKAVNAGVDIDMVSFAYNKHLENIVATGVVSESQIDNIVRNILRMKFSLGLFENPYVPANKQNYYSQEALSVAKQAAIESVILLKNDNEILPLKNKKKIAVIGPLADAPADQLGTWCFDADPSRSVTPIQSIKKEYSENSKIFFEKTLNYSRDKNKEWFSKAIKAARKSDVILFFAGEEAILSGEGKCRADLSLPGVQTDLIKELKKTGKPLVLIVMAGRPLTIEKEIDMSDAVLYAFHGGTMAGPALADLIFGKAVPSGKLPVTMPKQVGQIPVYYSHKNTGRPPKGFMLIDDIPVGGGQNSIGFTCYHLDAGSEPLYPFGYGLSYTHFKYSTPLLSSNILNGNEKSLTVTCQITNTGSVDAYETVQLYVRDLVAFLARPVKELKGFQKIYLKSGETKTVQFDITAEQLSFWNENLKQVTEPGKFYLWIAPDSNSGNPVEFTYKNI